MILASLGMTILSTKGITISGNNTSRLVYVSRPTLKTVTLTKGHSDFASALESRKRLLGDLSQEFCPPSWLESDPDFAGGWLSLTGTSTI
jgi:hypothetical protein